MGTDSILLERAGHVALLTLNRPDKLNALNAELLGELHAALEELHHDDEVRALVISGAGRGFSSGADLTGRPRGSGEAPRPERQSQNQRLDPLGWVGRLAKGIYEFDKPTLAAVNGVAAGAGMSLALACDMRVGSEHARFKTVFLERSLSPDSGMTFFLPRIVGYSRAADLIFSSRSVDAQEAYRIGLLDRLVAAAELRDRALELASQIASMPPLALRSAKRVLQHNLEADLDSALRFEMQGLDYARRSAHDVAESRASFVEKRPPVFTGE
jgi:2-(1,2-epoxy-1,2-dihydrophenyl)acetyl-CoA isomerase